MISSSFEGLYQNIYASGYDGTLVTMDGYYDPTERDNTIISGNLVNELELNGIAYLMGEFIATDNTNLRHDANWSTTNDDNEIFNTRPMDLLLNSGGVATALDYDTTKSSNCI